MAEQAINLTSSRAQKFLVLGLMHTLGAVAAIVGLLAALLVTVGGYPTLFVSTAVAAALGAARV
ncbi:MAG: hypothetical protein ACYCO9_14560 [Streptosporangiaceae bacterium]